MNTRVVRVLPESIAEEMEICKGDKIISINGKRLNDIIDYLYAVVDDFLEIEVEKPDGQVWVLEIDKDYDEEVGIEFENPIIDQAKSCKNNCIFCFVDQLPPNMRDSLYFKDDDSRLSFLQGNYVTLTNVTDEEFNRIIDYNISPINVSVHTTNPELRVKMLKNPKAAHVLERVKILVDNRVDVNAQIVLCPGFNDGEELDRTLTELGNLSEHLVSVAIVPVGLSGHREGLAQLNGYNKEAALEVIQRVEKWQGYFLDKRESRFVFLSDEFYVTAEKEVPPSENYEGFHMVEDGVGLMRKFKDEIINHLEEVDLKFEEPLTVSIGTGVSAHKYMIQVCELVKRKYPQINFNVFLVENEYFGKSITVAGLLTGTDLYNNLKGEVLGDLLLIPDVMLKADTELFLDDWTVSQLQEKLNVKASIIKVQGNDFMDKIDNYRGENNE